jgi:hypothetical protein
MSDNISLRKQVQYIPKELKIINNRKKSIILDIDLIEIENKPFDNQITCGNQLVTHFTDKKVVVQLVIGLTQSGKTGAMISFIKYYIKHTDTIIHPKNIYIITGLSSIEWKEQTKNRFPDFLEKNIFHNGDLKSFKEKIKDEKNVLIIMDEIQYGGKEKQGIYNTFKELKYYDANNLLENDIKIVEFTATPDGHFKDIKDLKKHSKIFKLDPGIGYTSIVDLLDKGRVKNAENLLCLKSNGELDYKLFDIKTKCIDLILNNYNEQKKHHIFRFPNTKDDKYDNILKLFKNKYKEGEYKYISYDGKTKIDIEEEVLKVKPKKHTFIIVKEKLRCAKTITKEHLGIVYERIPMKDVIDSTIVQGLAGRVTGYDITDDIYCFTHIVSIQNYRILWDNNFEEDYISWKGNVIKGKTFNNGLSNHIIEDKEDIICQQFNRFDEAQQYVINILKRKQNPHSLDSRKKDNEGYYICPINNKKGKASKRSYKYIKNNRKNALGSKPYVCRICYEDINDKDTIKFVIIHKK